MRFKDLPVFANISSAATPQLASILSLLSLGIMQQFAISEATLFGWNSMDGESMGAGSNQGSVAHLSEVNQESITSRGTAV